MIIEIPYKDQKDIDGSIIPREAVFQMYRKLSGKVVRFKDVLYHINSVTLSSTEEFILLDSKTVEEGKERRIKQYEQTMDTSLRQTTE